MVQGLRFVDSGLSMALVLYVMFKGERPKLLKRGHFTGLNAGLKFGFRLSLY